ncbi:nuclease-related domain-containing protein [Methylophaga sulfidovorans]|uniref:Topoisomerase DNA binding C4 zinc finger n=1 Tax=Methylophaga sulfidovorans TaxID=45496 RepID=A0A1I4A7V0_9GAMM|nr:NERD domain-containing protein [Methylophaga sulfidovorans]SFK52021.1 Topoisomerase DNA binding C4 zinc finger [Methylophaga sulfidovorans]
MDFTPLFSSLLSFWYFIPLVLCLAIFRSAWFKSIMGEFMVNVIARWQLDKEHYHLIKNVTLPSEDGTTQIDHIIVSVYGVFVVETKNIRGWIFGNPAQKNWTQQLYKHKYRFQNPLHQNHKHLKTLQTLLNLADEQVFSVIVFIGDSHFKTAMPDNVTYGLGYVRYIKSKTNPVLTLREKESVISQIESGRLSRSLKTNREHVAHVKQLVERKNMDVTLCSRCGHKMVKRQSRKGDNAGQFFWGCSQYPKCRNIDTI